MKLINNSNKIYNKNIYNILLKGKIIYLKYILIKNDEIRISNFIGICISIKKKSNSILLKNTVKKYEVNLTICGHSPLIIQIKILKKYKKKYRLSKLYYK